MEEKYALYKHIKAVAITLKSRRQYTILTQPYI